MIQMQSNLMKKNKEMELAKLKSKYNFDIEKKIVEDKPIKLNTLFYGGKNSGKTVEALLSYGKLLVFSYDGLTKPIYRQLEKMNPSMKDRVKIIDVRYIDDPEVSNDMSFLNYNLIKEVILEKFADFKPQWVVHDGLDILNKICEGNMRFTRNLGPFDTVSNLNWWKERNAYLNYIHKISEDLSEFGVIYTAYYDDSNTFEFHDSNGDIIERKQPKYLELVKYDVLISIEMEQSSIKDKKISEFIGTVDSSKIEDFIKTGSRFNVSNYQPILSKKRLEKFYGKEFPDLSENSEKEEVVKENKKENEKVNEKENEETKEEDIEDNKEDKSDEEENNFL